MKDIRIDLAFLTFSMVQAEFYYTLFGRNMRSSKPSSALRFRGFRT